MESVDSKACNNIEKDAANDSLEKNCAKSRCTHSCEVMIDFRTCLNPPPKENKVKETIKVEAKIEKICKGKIIIGGILHKTIKYKSETEDECCECKHVKQKDIPFSCFIDIDCDNSEDEFEIVECRTICTFSEVIHSEEEYCDRAILVEKDIIKIIVKRTFCAEECREKGRHKFCGKAVVESEICFVPGVNPKVATVSVSIDPANFKVELACCDLIVVCGFITKIVTFTDGAPTVKKDILVQVEVPAGIDECDEAEANKWRVTKAEVCTGCFNFTCPNENATLFHKLIEKDIIAVQVDHVG